ncbi:MULTISPECIES: NB-ARC domain-containing protein [unclassified Microcoleus]|uniref:NB-ARC domain-containing protein n=1 Tax=unclassified Microcoleus TaxID=2642155 RepID=UPI0025DBBACA|nr:MULTISPECIES: NB-ARC domain-containing protein [unclassified Microcoleus]
MSKDLKQRLLANNRTLVVSAIHGLGSVGKSTSAAALAHDRDIQNHFSDGILWATLGQEPNVLQRLTDWVHGLGDYNYPVTDMHSTSLHLRTLMTDKAMLLVVDDAWIDKNNGWEYVKAFNVGGSRCCLLVTTRDASIANVLGASTYPLDVMTKTQALDLLVQKLKTLGKQLEISEIESAKCLAKAVGYLPLALELAAVQVANGTNWQVLIADIQQEIARLKSLQDPGIRNLGDDEKFKKLSLQASLNLSIKRLEEYERECFAWLGVLPEDANITHLMTATVWDIDERDAMAILQYFQSQALLLPGVTLADGTITYRLHDLFHDLARNLLTAPQKPKRQGDLLGLGIKWEDAHIQLLNKYQQQTADNYWHTLPDDGYIHQYLVWHLEKTEKIAEIHQLLREESASGHNGWYEVREKLGQVAGFLTDVSRAWALTETDFEKDRSEVISLQCRYGLIVSSLNSLSANIPEKLLVMLVKNGYWKPEQGLAYALQKPDLVAKAYSLIALADYLPDNLKNQALSTALEKIPQIQNEYYHDKSTRALVLSSLVEKLQSKNLYSEALEIIHQIQDESSRADLLSYFLQAEKLQSEDLYSQGLKIVSKIMDESDRAKVISSLSEKLQSETLYSEVLEIISLSLHESDRAEILSYLVQKLPANLYSKALEVVRKIWDEYDRARVLSLLVTKLPENLDSEALEIARQIYHEKYRARVLSSLAIKLQSENLYLEVLAIVRHIQYECSRADVLSWLSEKLPENLYCEALGTVRQIHDEYNRVCVLSSLATKLHSENLHSESLYLEVLETVGKIRYGFYPTYVLSSLAEELPEHLYSKALEISRQIQNEYERADFISSLAKKMPENLYSKALEISRQIQNEYYRAGVISSLATKLHSENLHLEALETAGKIKYEFDRATVLSSVVLKLPKKLYFQTLETTRQIHDEEARSIVLSSLVENLPESLYSEALKISRQIHNGKYRASVLLSLATKLQSETLYSEALATVRQTQDEFYIYKFLSSFLAEKLPENMYLEALATARQIQDEEYRDRVLSSLAVNLPENLYSEALAAARQIHNQSTRAEVLSSLAEKLQSENLYSEALATARQIQNQSTRAEILSSLAEKLQSENLYSEALEITSQIQSESDLVRVLSSLAEKLPENLYSELLEITSQIQSESNRAKVLSSLLNAMPSSQPKNEVYKMWLEIMKTTLSKLKRPEFHENIDALTPVVYKLGGKDAIMEIVTAIQDVARWWP